MKNSFIVIFFATSILIACVNHEKTKNTQKNNTTAINNEDFTNYVQIIEDEPEEDAPEEIEETESVVSEYILDKEPDISIDRDSVPIKLDYAFVARNSLNFGENDFYEPDVLSVKGDVLSFTFSPDGKFIYFALKAELNETTKKVIEKLEYQFEAYDLKIYKLDLQKPFKAEYITTLYNKTTEYTEGNYFLDYGNPDFQITCNGDSLLVYCEPEGGEGGFMSMYVVSLYDRKTSLQNNYYIKCKFPSYVKNSDQRDFEYEVSGDKMEVFYSPDEESDKNLIFIHNSWEDLFKEYPQTISYLKTYKNYFSNFHFSISPSSNIIAYSAFELGEMDVRSGATYIYNRKDSTTFEVSKEVVLGGWYGEYRWLSNDNLLLYSSRYNKLFLIDTESKHIPTIGDVIFFQAAPF